MSEIEHKVYTLIDDSVVADDSILQEVDYAVIATLHSEGVDESCSVTVLITDDSKIHEYNLKYRDIDKATDVLSFPMQEFNGPGWENHGDLDYDENMSELPLGDIIISVESVKRQAAEYENTVGYETAYLMIHSTLHLLGYDHENEKNEKIMHDKIKAIVNELDV